MSDHESKAPVILVVAGALFDATRDAVLLTERPAGKANAGEWEFPGGKPESGETPELALARELKEEIDVIVDPAAMSPAGFASYAYPDRHVLLMLYAIREWHGTPQGLEGQGLQWVKRADLPDFVVLPADRPLIEKLPCYL
jgi:8-oxo-dGTP diphosphatase